MATLALVAVAAASPGALVGVQLAVAMTAATAFDNLVLFPKLFPQDPSEAGRVGDIQIGGAEEGTPLFQCVGATAKMPGNLIWASPLREVAATSQVGKNSTVINYRYYGSGAIEICSNRIAKLLRVWADGDLIYDDDRAALSLVNSNFRMEVPGGAGSGTTAYLKIDTVSTGVDLNDVRVGSNQEVTLSGFTNGSNNGTFTVLSKGTLGVDTYLYLRRTSGVFITEGTGATKTVSQPVPGWAPGVQISGTPKVRLGLTTQAPDTTIESFEGTGNVPAYRGVAYVVFDDFNFTKYGNRWPTFEFLVETYGGTDVSDGIDQLMTQAGVDASRYDTSGISSQAMSGYVRRGVQSLSQTLQPVMLAYNLTSRERDGKMMFLDLDAVDTVVLTEDEMLAGKNQGPVDFAHNSSRKKPGEVIVTYVDEELDYSVRTQRAAVAEKLDKDILQSNIPLVLSGDQAREVANRLLHLLQSNDRSATLRLPPSFLLLEEGDLLSITLHGEPTLLRITEKIRGVNGIIEVYCIVDDLVGRTFTSLPAP